MQLCLQSMTDQFRPHRLSVLAMLGKPHAATGYIDQGKVAIGEHMAQARSTSPCNAPDDAHRRVLLATDSACSIAQSNPVGARIGLVAAMRYRRRFRSPTGA